jgi:hypothetical protein
MVNITLSANERVVVRARKAAQSMGMSLNQVVRIFLSELAGESSAEDELAEIVKLSGQSGGRRRGWEFDRDEIHERT